MKKILVSLLTIAGIGFTPIASYAAHEIHIHNGTSDPSASRMNGGLCSSFILGDGGVTKAGESKTIPGLQVDLACGHKPECYADVYLSRDCKTKLIATVHLNTATGFELGKEKIIDTHYKIDFPNDPNDPEHHYYISLSPA